MRNWIQFVRITGKHNEIPAYEYCWWKWSACTQKPCKIVVAGMFWYYYWNFLPRSRRIFHRISLASQHISHGNCSNLHRNWMNCQHRMNPAKKLPTNHHDIAHLTASTRKITFCNINVWKQLDLSNWSFKERWRKHMNSTHIWLANGKKGQLSI